MASPAAKSSIRQEDSESPPIPAQSVLDWAMDEEDDHSGKLDRYGRPLASFHELRTRETNKEPGSWTLNHAIHVATREFHQASKEGDRLSRMWRMGLYLYTCLDLARIYSRTGRGDNTGFVQASEKAISFLEKRVRHAVEVRRNGGFVTSMGVKTHWSEKFPKKSKFLAARFSSPTGDLPESLKQNLLKLDLYDQLDIVRSYPAAIEEQAARSVSTAVATCATRIEHASLSEQKKLENSSVQQDLNGAMKNRVEKLTPPTLKKKRKHDDSMIEDRVEAALEKHRKLDDSMIEERVEAALEKQRKLNDSIIENRVEAIFEKKFGPYKALLQDYTEYTDYLTSGLGISGDLADKADSLKQRQEELDTAAPKAAVPLQGEVEAGESHQTE